MILVLRHGVIRSTCSIVQYTRLTARPNSLSWWSSYAGHRRARSCWLAGYMQPPEQRPALVALHAPTSCHGNH